MSMVRTYLDQAYYWNTMES